jgi:hypothetical protein
MDCCACWFDDSTFLKEALSLTPTYLRGTGNMFDYKDWQIPLGRYSTVLLGAGTVLLCCCRGVAVVLLLLR